ncbi:MAG TPA: CUAEP/CCAEP-tail radical SAM protein [Candidatus Polarisedimenticolaceae bacterium]|nr:CUAEP/CCAEP-tail radical SAM protein [Candidatus Polarisedimenticolaceae bacterium]
MRRVPTPTTSRPSRPALRRIEIRLVSCYELGHQPLAVATAQAALERCGFRPAAVDLAVEPLAAEAASRPADLIAISVPMHTALHIGVAAARRLRGAHEAAHICLYGLYASLNADYLLGAGLCDSIVGGEFERPLVDLARALAGGSPVEEVRGLRLAGRPSPPNVERTPFDLPARGGLPPLERYAKLRIDGGERTAAAIEASRGCLHHCRHCPIPPVYDGRFFVVPRELVLGDVRNLVAAGVRHLTFADPDFLNGPRHTMTLAREIHEEFPHLTFDVTTKIENLLRHRERLPQLARFGCVFVVSAVESLNDTVLEHLAKGHTRRDVFEAQRLVARAGIALRPSLVPFTPWETLDSYRELLDWIECDALADGIDPVQLSIRLLVPPGSLLERSPAMRPYLRAFEPQRFGHRWDHPDPRMDALQREVARIVARAARHAEPGRATHARIRRAAGVPASPVPTRVPPALAAADPPRLTEPWFC